MNSERLNISLLSSYISCINYMQISFKNIIISVLRLYRHCIPAKPNLFPVLLYLPVYYPAQQGVRGGVPHGNTPHGSYSIATQRGQHVHISESEKLLFDFKLA